MTAPKLVPGCDATNPPICADGMDADGQLTFRCRCIVCSRCQHHTGNTNQGHYWSYCKVTRETRDFHFCCPDACELTVDGAA